MKHSTELWVGHQGGWTSIGSQLGLGNCSMVEWQDCWGHQEQGLLLLLLQGSIWGAMECEGQETSGASLGQSWSSGQGCLWFDLPPSLGCNGRLHGTMGLWIG